MHAKRTFAPYIGHGKKIPAGRRENPMAPGFYAGDATGIIRLPGFPGIQIRPSAYHGAVTYRSSHYQKAEGLDY